MRGAGDAADLAQQTTSGPATRVVRCAHERAPVGSRFGSRSPVPAAPYHARGTAQGGGPRRARRPAGVFRAGSPGKRP